MTDTLPPIPRKCDIKHDRGSFPDELIGKVVVCIDGVGIEQVTAYDCDEGWVRCDMRGPDGELILENDSVAQKTLRGQVTATLG